MNRTIKFRSWDGKKMWNEFGLYGHKLNAGLVAVADQGDILMQFTGLLDKNGEEIYEGDILGANGEPRGIVTFQNGAFRGLYYYNPTIGGWAYSDEWEDDIHRTNDVVIGNIYENPELLTI